ncbi:MAG: transketolase C-terminal domain-containing protein [Candidatus Diapherotrites archaeon]|nr:transketolase C-terminal domain-containing protein [Candidatus Diapherotrites archaeon]
MSEQSNGFLKKWNAAAMDLCPDPFRPSSFGSTRDGFGKGLLETAELHENIWVVSADVQESTRVHWFAEKFPNRFIQVGIAEQNLAGIAAGISSCNKIVFMSAFAAFSPGRNWDQIRVSICYQNSNVKIHSSHSGLTVGADGATHQALEDIGILRTLPNMTIVVPCDFEQAKKAVKLIALHSGPVYLRTVREKSPVFTSSKTPFEIGKFNVYKEGKDIAIFACGFTVYPALHAAFELEKEGIDCAVIDAHTIKPIDQDSILFWANTTKLLISIEDHQVTGGLGSAIAEVLAETKTNAILKRHGIYDLFGESGECEQLLKKYKLDYVGISEVVRTAWNSLKVKL